MVIKTEFAQKNINININININVNIQISTLIYFSFFTSIMHLATLRVGLRWPMCASTTTQLEGCLVKAHIKLKDDLQFVSHSPTLA